MTVLESLTGYFNYRELFYFDMLYDVHVNNP